MNSLLDLFEKSSDATCAMNGNQQIIYWNSKAERMLGYRRDEVMGRYCWQLFRGRAVQGQPLCRPDCQVLCRVHADTPVDNFDMVVEAQGKMKIRVNVSTIPVPPEQEGAEAGLLHLLRPWRPAPPKFSAVRLCFLR